MGSSSTEMFRNKTQKAKQEQQQKQKEQDHCFPSGEGELPQEQILAEIVGFILQDCFSGDRIHQPLLKEGT